jgi:hypothetical protein
MMKKIVPFMLLALILASYAALVTSVRAYDETNPPPTNPYVWAEDQNGNMKDVFQLGESLIVRAYSAGTPYTVKLFDPDGVLVLDSVSANIWFSSGILDNATNKLGKWDLLVNDSHQKYAVGEYDVIPQAAFGVIGLLGACLAGFGLKSIMARKAK